MDKPERNILSGDGFSRRTPTTSGKLAETLQRAILAGQYPIGTALPSERDLTVDYDVSRTTVREALRILAADGLVEVLRGRNGGSFVCAPSHKAATRSLYFLINDKMFRFVDLLAAREAIEPVAASQAAVFRDETDIKILKKLCQDCEDAVEDLEVFVGLNLAWHKAVVDASKNLLFKAFIESISLPVREVTDLQLFGLDTRKAVVRAHWKIFAAIEEGNPETARRRMARHTSAYGEEVEAMHMPSSEKGGREKTTKIVAASSKKKPSKSRRKR